MTRALVSLLVSFGGAVLIGLAFVALATKRPAVLIAIAIGLQVTGGVGRGAIGLWGVIIICF